MVMCHFFSNFAPLNTKAIMNHSLSQYRPHYGVLARLGAPIVVGQLGTIVLSFADTLMIGHHSTPELAAAAFVNNMFNLVIILALGFSYAVTPTVGTLYGEGRKDRVGEVLKNALASGTLLALLLVVTMAVLWLNVERLGQPIELLPLIKPYFLVLLASLPFVCWFNAFKQFADGITRTALPMWVMLSGNVLNIVGNWALIYGHLGLPELGLTGAGVSTLLSRVLMVAAMAAVFFMNSRYRKYADGFRQGAVNRADFMRLNTMGWPLALQMGMETAAFSLSSIMVGWIGTTALAAHQVMLTISQLGFMVYYGIGAAAAVRVSLLVGQRDVRSATSCAYAAMHIVLLLAVMVCVPLYIMRHDIGFLFSSSADVCAMVAMTMTPFMLYQAGDGMQIIFSNGLRGLSNVRPLAPVALLSYFIVSLPLSYLFGIVMGMGLTGVWMAFPFGLTTAGVLYLLHFRRTVRRMCA